MSLSYIAIPQKSQKDTKIKASLLINSITNKPNIEFTVSLPNKVYFYRISSIMTLQMQELEKLEPIVEKAGNITTSMYLSLEEEELQLLGTDGGSIIVVDSRSATVLVLCVGVIKGPVSRLFFWEGSLIVLSEKSQNITVYPGIANLNDLISCVDRSPKIMTLDSSISSVSNFNK